MHFILLRILALQLTIILGIGNSTDFFLVIKDTVIFVENIQKLTKVSKE